ncbi:MAG: peptidoglycan-binding domain-containing protein [Pseudomonadota bacterium]
MGGFALAVVAAASPFIVASLNQIAEIDPKTATNELPRLQSVGVMASGHGQPEPLRLSPTPAEVFAQSSNPRSAEEVHIGSRVLAAGQNIDLAPITAHPFRSPEPVVTRPPSAGTGTPALTLPAGEAADTLLAGAIERSPIATSPRRGLHKPERGPWPAIPAILAAELAENALALEPKQRRRIQADLRVLGHDPMGIDGVFGPNTRKAITAWQVAAGHLGTGYIEGTQHLELRRTSGTRLAEYRARMRNEEQLRAAALDGLLVVPSARNAPECDRNRSGIIIENQSFSCDLTVLEESLSDLFGGSG